jgi:hypothetical protein
MKKILVVLSLVLFTFCGCFSMGGGGGSPARKAGSGETAVLVQRVEMPINAGFKERIYIDGREHLVLTNGSSGTIIVPNGEHTISADLYTLSTGKVPFTAQSRELKFIVTPYSLQDFAIEELEESDSDPVLANASANAGPVYSDNSVEGSLLKAAGKIMDKIPPQSRMAIVYVTSKDTDVTEYIANELEFIMVEQGLTLIDRSQLDRIRQEQNFQLSGEVDDRQAVSVGKLAGADIILTGAVTGAGELRRLRLRALNTQTGQVVTAASEKY